MRRPPDYVTSPIIGQLRKIYCNSTNTVACTLEIIFYISSYALCTVHHALYTMQNDQLVFNGFDCRVLKENSIFLFLTKDWCQPAISSGKNA